MSTPSDPSAAPTSSGGSAQARRELRLMVLFVAAMLLFGLACWFAVSPATQLAKQWLARRQLPVVRQHLNEGRWQQAATTLRDARRWAPNDPAVIRATLEFITKTDGDPHNALNFITQLQQMGAATLSDLALMGKMHAQLGETAKARAIYVQLPPAERQHRLGLELHAALLMADGFFEQAAQARRAAWLQALDQNPADAATLLSLARMDLSSNDPSRRDAMHERLWRLARSQTPVKFTAIELLADDKALTVPQAAELSQIVATTSAPAAQPEAVRFIALSAQIRVSPQLRTDLIDAEIMRWKNRPPTQTAPLLAWLVQEHEYARILRMLPRNTAARYPDLLPHYVDALRGERQWQELHTLLTSGGIDPAVPAQRRRLWLAEAQARLHPDLEQSRQTLARIYEEAGRGEDLTTTLETGHLAEQLNQWDLALKCYAAVANKHAHTQLAMQARIYQMAEHQHDGPGMLSACVKLLELQPENALMLTQKLYLQLLLGVELETAHLLLQNLAHTKTLPRPELLHLLRALAAYRHGQIDSVHASLVQVAKPAALPAGERAVYAALLKQTGGDPGTAFRLVERIPPALLLPEERVFLHKAL